MALLLEIVTSHLTGIARSLLFFTLNDIVSYCRGRVLFFVPLLFFLFAIGLDKLIKMG